ncbi:MAG: acylneuraminate cytidylyltransferase family protein [Tepidisphaeraceae bacterium]
MNVLGVILARGGSKGLPDKHLLDLAGKPVIAHTFAHVRAARLLSRVVVSSDCVRILRLAGEHGFEALRRPIELATDSASVQDVLLHAMDALEAEGSEHIDAVVTLYGNVALRRAGVIDEAIELLERTGCDSARSFVPVGKWHPRWMSRIDGDRAVACHAGSIHRRQDLEPLFLHDGGVVVSSREAMERGRADRSDPHGFFGVDRRAVMCEPTDTVEIDSRRDLLLADAILRDQALANEVKVA